MLRFIPAFCFESLSSGQEFYVLNSFFYYILSGAEAGSIELLKILVVTRPCEAHFIPINFLRTADSLKFVVLRRILIHYAIVELRARKICWRKPLRNKMAMSVCSVSAA